MFDDMYMLCVGDRTMLMFDVAEDGGGDGLRDAFVGYLGTHGIES